MNFYWLLYLVCFRCVIFCMFCWFEHEKNENFLNFFKIRCNYDIKFKQYFYLTLQKPKKKTGGYVKPTTQKVVLVQKREKRQNKSANQKTIKQLLGELYADKVYLEHLLEDDCKRNHNSNLNSSTSSSNSAANSNS